MTRHRFLVPGPIEEGADCVLDEGQSRQVQSVLRLRTGDRITVFDGSGSEGVAVLVEIDRRSANCRIESVTQPEREPAIDLTVGLALLRGDRFDLALQKLTEVGVRRVVPLAAERCVLSFRDARDWEKRAVRYRRIIVEAMEQSERVTSVELEPPCSPSEFIKRHDALVLRERSTTTPLMTLPLQPSMAIAIGPEGGWSDAELDAVDRHATSVTLGGLILRAETAAIVAAAMLTQRSYFLK